MSAPRAYPLPEALKAIAALREAAGLTPEQFTLPAFVGMISDEIEALRRRGRSDEEIATIVRRSSAIDLRADQVAQFYAPSEQRQHSHG